MDDEDISSTEKTTSPKNDADAANWGIGSLDKDCLQHMHPAGEKSMSDHDNYLSCHSRDNTVTVSTCPR